MQTDYNALTALSYNGHTVRLKWHKLRIQAQDPPFSRHHLRAGLSAGASLEVDIRRLACGRFICLHDAVLEGETTGSGPVIAATADTVDGLEMLGNPGEPPLLFDELLSIVRTTPAAAGARIQLDLKAAAADIDAAVTATFQTAVAAQAGRFILSGRDWDAVTALGAGVNGLLLGYDPIEDVAAVDVTDVVSLVRERAAAADTVYLYRELVRVAQQHDYPLVGQLQSHGYRVDCWTIDYDTSEVMLTDMRAAIAAGCDEITTNTALDWVSYRAALA
jgi:glycerophosphoryl diester phosphodiesterase